MREVEGKPKYKHSEQEWNRDVIEGLGDIFNGKNEREEGRLE